MSQHHTLVRLTSTGLPVHVEAGGYELATGPAFDDWRGDWWLAEELLVAAVGSSLLETFRARAKDQRLALGAVRCTAEAVFHDGRGSPLARLIFRVELEAAARDLDHAQHALRSARETCPLATALRVPIELQITPLPATVAVAMIEPA